MNGNFKHRPIDLSKAMRMFNNDVELFLTLINKFIREYPRYLKRILNAIKEKNLKELTIISYKIRSLLVNLGADDAEEYLAAIERFKEFKRVCFKTRMG